MAPQSGSSDEKPGGLAVATQVVGLFAGVVTIVYVIGGVVLALRLIFRAFSIDSVVSVVGQLPRESVVSTAMVDAVGPAALLGLLGMAAYASLTGWADQQYATGSFVKKINGTLVWLDDKPRRRIPTVLLLAAVLVAPATVKVLLDADWDLDWNQIVLLVGYLGVCAALFIGRTLVRQIVESADRKDDLKQVLLVGVIVTGVGIIPAVLVAGAIQFDQAQACISDDPDHPVVGYLISDTDDRVLMIEDDDASDTETVVSLPSSRVAQLEYGDDPVFDEDCPEAAG